MKARRFQRRGFFFLKLLSIITTAVLTLGTLNVGASSVREVVRLAADLTTTPNGSNPGSFTIINDILYFVANDGAHGIELWRTDGTNLTRITDICPGTLSSLIGPPVLYNGEIY